MARRRNLWCAALGVIVALVVVAGYMWYQDYFGWSRLYRPTNSIMVLMPYRYADTWVFDDSAAGLHREPFVGGIPEMIDELVKDIPDAHQGFRLFFSSQPFPGYTHKLVWRRSDGNGNWYYSETLQKEGWLCPALFKYFTRPPKELYVKAEPR